MSYRQDYFIYIIAILHVYTVCLYCDWGNMKFSGTHWKCIAQEFPMLFQFVPLIFTLAHLFVVSV